MQTTNFNDYPEVLNVSDIQSILDIGRKQAYELVHSGKFHAVKIGNRIKISKKVFINWLEGTDIDNKFIKS